MNTMIRIALVTLSTIVLLTRCANVNVAGGSSDQGNAIISGSVVDAQGTGVPGASLRLLPQDYIPGIDTFHQDSFIVSTDSAGCFSISNIGKGTYCLSGSNSAKTAFGMVSFLTVDSQDIQQVELLLQEPGRIKFPIDDSLWEIHKDILVYIPGTTMQKNLSAETTAISFDTVFPGRQSLRFYSFTTQTSAVLNKRLTSCFVLPGILTNFTIQPFKPRGPQVAVVNASCKFYTFFEYWNINSNIDVEFLEYRYYWGNQDTSAWCSTLANSHSWMQPGTYEIKIQVRYGVKAQQFSDTIVSDALTPFYSNWSDSTLVTVTTR